MHSYLCPHIYMYNICTDLYKCHMYIPPHTLYQPPPTHTYILPLYTPLTGSTSRSDSFLPVHAVATFCLLPSPTILQPGLSQYAVLRNRYPFAIRWAKSGYHGNAVPWRLDDSFDVCQCVSVICTPERVWCAEESILPYYWSVIKELINH